jgi:oligopeptide transport system substrate-binding protein
MATRITKVHEKKPPRFLCLLVFFVAMALLPGCSRETAVQRGNREQVLHRGLGSAEPSTLDPQLATQAGEFNVLAALFEGLVVEDPLDLHPVPGVAESWDLSPDRRTYTFQLRADARWSNGDPVTARDFVASFRRALTPAFAAPDAPLLDLIQGAEAFRRGTTQDAAEVGLAAPDDRTLRITLDHPSPTFLPILTQPVCFPLHLASIAQTGPPDARSTDWARPGKLVGNGPFNLTAWQPGREIVVEKSATYWDAATVRLRAIHFHPLDPEAEERAFRAGQLHLTDALPPAKVDAWRKDPSGALRADPLLGTYFYRLNTRQPNLDNAKVRRALALAVDRRAIVEKILRGGQLPATTFIPPTLAGYIPPAGLATDFAAARQLLVDAGFPGGSGLPPLELLYNTSDTHRVIAEAVQEMWRRELGVEVRLVNEENASTLAARSTGSYQILRSSWTADYADPASFLEIWTRASGNNFTGWSNVAYDALVREAGLAPTAPARAELYRQAEAILLAAAPIIPIYHYTHVYLLAPAVQGWFPTALDHHPYKHVWLKE